MDNITDNEKQNAVSRVLSDKNIRTQPFGANVAAERAYARAERIAAAFHLVTNHIPEQEPLRIQVRQSALALIALILEGRDVMRVGESRSNVELVATIRRLISAARLLAVSGYVSIQNADVLVDALDDLAAYILAARRTNLSETIAFSREEFLGAGGQAIEHKGQSQRSVKDRASRAPLPSRADRSSARRESILAVLSSQGAVGIKDIAAQLPEYSDKMIQRELKTLVGAGKVVKSGSKRWSMYKLA